MLFFRRVMRKLVEKPRDFDPFGQTGFAHLWLQYDCPFKVLVLGVIWHITVPGKATRL